ncbi:hypothetical protein [Salinicoccus roseus]|uniref:hypothetical protein n=1 Tax=Salinicoccus roseus TaxID=45670 RepID=UPI00356690F8
MERNYRKEVALANKKNAELQEQVFAYQALYDDAMQKLKQFEEESEGNKVHIVEADK